jgi:hypothetical protein
MVLTIDRVRSIKPRFIVRDDGGTRGTWAKEKLFKSTLAGDLDGERYSFRDDGPKRFVFAQSDLIIASADRGKQGSWTLNADDWSGELRPASAWRSAMEVRSEGEVLGTIQKGKRLKHLVVCDLPATLPTGVQAFIAFLALTIWNSGGAEPGLAGGLGQLGS